MRQTFKENHSISSGMIHIKNKNTKSLYINELNICLNKREIGKKIFILVKCRRHNLSFFVLVN